MPDARWLDRDALARHICVRPDAIARLTKAGRLPEPQWCGCRQPPETAGKRSDINVV